MSHIAQRCLSAIAYSVGEHKEIDALAQAEEAGGAVLADLKMRGLRFYRDEIRSIPEACLSTALETLRLSSLAPEQIDIVLLATSNARWVNSLDEETSLFMAFRNAGFCQTRLIGISLQACSAFGESIRIASDLVGQEGSLRVLVILFGRKETASRLGPAGSTVYSDGAASCLVQGRQVGFQIAASESLFDLHLGSMGRLGNFEQFVGGVHNLGEICKRVYEKTNIRPDDVRVLLCTNGSLVHLRVMANAARIPLERVYSADVARFGHVYSCDNLISLKNYAAENDLSLGENYLLLGWSPHVVSAAMVRYVGGN